MHLLLALSVASLVGLSMACDAYTGGLPTATGKVSSKAVIEVAAGEVFDGGWKKYDRGSGACRYVFLHERNIVMNTCYPSGQSEGGTHFMISC